MQRRKLSLSQYLGTKGPGLPATIHIPRQSDACPLVFSKQKEAPAAWVSQEIISAGLGWHPRPVAPFASWWRFLLCLGPIGSGSNNRQPSRHVPPDNAAELCCSPPPVFEGKPLPRRPLERPFDRRQRIPGFGFGYRRVPDKCPSVVPPLGEPRDTGDCWLWKEISKRWPGI